MVCGFVSKRLLQNGINHLLSKANNWANVSHPSQRGPRRSRSQIFKAKIGIFRHSESTCFWLRVSKAKVIHFEATLQVRGNMLDNLVFGDSWLHHAWLIFTLTNLDQAHCV